MVAGVLVSAEAFGQANKSLVCVRFMKCFVFKPAPVLLIPLVISKSCRFAHISTFQLHVVTDMSSGGLS